MVDELQEFRSGVPQVWEVTNPEPAMLSLADSASPALTSYAAGSKLAPVLRSHPWRAPLREQR